MPSAHPLPPLGGVRGTSVHRAPSSPMRRITSSGAPVRAARGCHVDAAEFIPVQFVGAEPGGRWPSSSPSSSRRGRCELPRERQCFSVDCGETVGPPVGDTDGRVPSGQRHCLPLSDTRHRFRPGHRCTPASPSPRLPPGGAGERHPSRCRHGSGGIGRDLPCRQPPSSLGPVCRVGSPAALADGLTRVHPRRVSRAAPWSGTVGFSGRMHLVQPRIVAAPTRGTSSGLRRSVGGVAAAVVAVTTQRRRAHGAGRR